MNPNKYIFPPEATSEETLEKLIGLLIADDVDEDSLINPALSPDEHEMHSFAVMLYITGVESGRLSNGFDHSDEAYIEVGKCADTLGLQDPMNIMFRIYDEHTNKDTTNRIWRSSELDELQTENVEDGIAHVIESFLDFVIDKSRLSVLSDHDLEPLRSAAREFAKIEATRFGIMEETDADGVLTLREYAGDITEVISDIMDQFKKNGISPQDVYESKADFNAAGPTYVHYLIPIIEFEAKHDNVLSSMRDAATDDLTLMEHVLGGIQRFADLDPLGIALQLFKKAILDPKM